MIRFIIPFLFITLLYSSEDIKYYVDNTSTLQTLAAVQTKKEQFIPLQQPNLGFIKTPVWLSITFTNPTSIKLKKVLVFRDVRLDSAEVYNEEGKLLWHMGDMLPYVNRYYNDPAIAVPIILDANTTLTYYIRFKNWTRMNLEYQVWDEAEYLDHLKNDNNFEVFFFGGVVVMLLYNMILFFFIRERAVLDYIIYHVMLMFVMLHHNGGIAKYFFKTSIGLDAGTVQIYFAAACTLLATQFARSFLKTKELVPKLDKVLLIFIGLNTLSIIVAILMSDFEKITHLNHYFFNITMVVQSITLLYVGAYMMLVLKNKIAIFYFTGWLTMMLGIIVTGLVAMGLVLRTDFTGNVLQFGTLVEVVLFSMGLAYRYKINQEQLTEKTKVIQEQAKLASMGEMLRHIAHQWRQPLSEINSVAMKIETDHRRQTMDNSSLDRNIEQIEMLTEHMSKTIQDFNGYFKSDKEKTSTNFESVVDKALDLVLSGLTKSDVEVQKVVEHREEVKIVEGELIQVLLVLLNNARDALKSSDTSEKWIKIRIAKEDNQHLIEVEDNAGGINKENLHRVFEPYFTTKFESQGVGIGLYMSKMIVEESLKGTLEVKNSEYGACFRITLPV